MEREAKMNLVGEYVFYENGKEICKQSNILTRFGKRFLTSYLAGAVTFDNKSIAVGIGNSTPSVNNTQLDFEFYRSAVSLGSIDIQTNPSTQASTYAVVYKTTLPTDIVGSIKEVGLFASATEGNTDYSSRFISTFENNLSWLNDAGSPAVTTYSPAPRIGNTWFSLTSPANQSTKYNLLTNFDLSGYSQNDSLTLAFKQQDTNLDYVFVRFYSTTNSYFEIRYPGDSSTDNKIVAKTLDNLYASGYGAGTPDAESIIQVSVGAQAKSSGSTTVLLDGLRINDEDSFNSSASIISRSVLTNAISKSYGREMDIEYRIGLTF
jgi:hypothetical protein